MKRSILQTTWRVVVVLTLLALTNASYGVAVAISQTGCVPPHLVWSADGLEMGMRMILLVGIMERW